MKKYLAILLALVMLVAVCACTQTQPIEPADDNAAENDGLMEETPVQVPVADAETPEGADNLVKKELVMGTNAYFQPYEFYEGENIIGIDAEIAAAIADKLGMTLRIEDMEFSSIISAVDSGLIDFGMAGMTVTEDRLKDVDFSSSYANGVQSVIVKEGSPITSVDDLFAEGASYKIAVQLGTTGDTYACDDFGAENVTQYSNGNGAVLALVGGDVDCVIIDNEPAKALVAENEGLVILETAYADEDYAICVKKGNTDLLNAINGAIDELTAEGVIDGIVSKYIG